MDQKATVLHKHTCVGRKCLLLLLTCFAIVVAAQEHTKTVAKSGSSTGTLEVQLRDVQTGYGTKGIVCIAPLQIRANQARFQEYKTDENGRLVLPLPAGEYLEKDLATGHKPMKSHTGVAAGAVSRKQVMMDPVEMPAELQGHAEHPGIEIINGFVVDGVKFKPIAGTHLHLEKSGASATSNQRGYFQLLYPYYSKQPVRPEIPPETETLVAKALGYEEYVLHGITLGGGGATITVELSSGTGREEATIPHGHGTPATPVEPSGPGVNPELLRWLSTPPEPDQTSCNMQTK